MSRIGKKPVAIPGGVTAAIADGVLTVKGPKGSLSLAKPAGVDFKVDNGVLQLSAVHRIQLFVQVRGMARLALWRLCARLGVDFQKPETESGPEEQRQDIDQPASQGSVARRLRGLNTQYIRQDRDRAQGFNHQTAWYPDIPAQILENLIQAVYAVAVGVDNPLEGLHDNSFYQVRQVAPELQGLP